MARVSTYLNFARNTEEAFSFYKSVFGGDYGRGGISRFRDIPPAEGMPEIAEEDKDLIMHVELPIVGGHLLYLKRDKFPHSLNLKFQSR